MKQNSTVDYLSCLVFRAASLVTRLLPLNASLFLGRRLGDIIYFFDVRHRLIACANIKKAVFPADDFRPALAITRRAYQSFGQNLVEISFIPRIDKAYLGKYIHIENSHLIEEAFKRGKGVIFLAVHEGNWELSNIICANLGFPFILFVRDQGLPRLNSLLNSYRLKQGAKLIHKQGGLRELVEVLKENQSIGMTADQGGKSGEIVKFFGRPASMSTGAVKLALKYGCSIIPVFYTRVNGPHTKVILDSVYTVSSCGNAGKDVRDNLQKLTGIYEKYIRQYPHEYLWTYKIWKYGREKEILILSDSKAGHLRQAESAARLIIRRLSAQGIKTSLFVREIKFRGRFSRFIFSRMASFASRDRYFRCLDFLRMGLSAESREGLNNLKPDVIISAGDKLSAVNYILARANQAKSVVLMRPASVDLKKFDLAIIPRHDRPKESGNVVITEGALNLIDADYLKERAQRLLQSGLLKAPLSGRCIGVLIGGNSRKFRLSREQLRRLSAQLKKTAEEDDADLLITTSRRTPPEAEQALKEEFGVYPRCKLLIIANENNHPDAVGGILGLSSLLIISPESISMISEAVSAQKHVVVFGASGLSRKHRRFLKNFAEKKYIYIKQVNELSGFLKEVFRDRPEINSPDDNSKAEEALDRLL